MKSKYTTDTHPSYKIVNLDTKTILKASELKFSTDLHDRLITATALLQKTPLITKDAKIKKANVVETIWD
ncbi:MAG: PIN domain-containing protein [Candidatus Cloacimonetes bacterium]|nr:PIN domain-containing protein [Candidatus Cloacimonadota bacterium]